jgi:peptide-methionine (R)-S-oxide reductase
MVPARLATGSLVREEQLVGHRLHFKRLSGSGPASGWVSVRLGEKELLVAREEPPAPLAAPLSAAPAIPEWIPPRTEKEWKEQLSPYEYSIMRQDGTDMMGMHEYIDFFPKEGYFACACCGLPLYSCQAKFKDHGWPAWDKCYFSESIGCHVGTRNDGCIENHCARCQSHLGHIFFGEYKTPCNERH